MYIKSDTNAVTPPSSASGFTCGTHTHIHTYTFVWVYMNVSTIVYMCVIHLSYVSTTEPYVSTKEPYVSTKEPNVALCIHKKALCIHKKPICIYVYMNVSTSVCMSVRHTFWHKCCYTTVIAVWLGLWQIYMYIQICLRVCAWKCVYISGNRYIYNLEQILSLRLQLLLARCFIFIDFYKYINIRLYV